MIGWLCECVRRYVRRKDHTVTDTDQSAPKTTERSEDDIKREIADGLHEAARALHVLEWKTDVLRRRRPPEQGQQP